MVEIGAETRAASHHLSVGEIAARSGVTVSALHFYERRGLIRSARSKGNQRRYQREVLRRVSIIKTAQALGLSLEQIADALSVLPPDRAPSAKDWGKMAAHWHADLTDRIARLGLLRDLLTGCIGCGCLSTEICPLRNADDAMSKHGQGPHYLDPEIAATYIAGSGELPEYASDWLKMRENLASRRRTRATGSK